MAQNNIIFTYESSSSDDLLEKSYVQSSGLGRRQTQTKPVTSYDKLFTFCPHCHQMTCQKHFGMTHLIHVQGKKQQST